ncbi:hypothetical protein KEF29_28175 [Streptomyces tuirus]|uniref:Uncharacterized protein n=1 Tax=Streptomyces tuirus TaxID=68278 RepID=A0A941J4T2_9ACTN|nr:hypothetical protein [Streptomyces tuirus]
MNKVMTRTHRPTTRRDQPTPGTTAPPSPGATAPPSPAATAGTAAATAATFATAATPATAAGSNSPPRTSGSTAPPRIPGGGRRTPAAGGRPPASARVKRPQTRPTDTRPPTLSGTRTAPRRAPQRLTTPPAVTGTPDSPSGGTDTTPRVPLQALRRPLPTDVFADLLVAVLSGHRPVHSMLRHTRGRAYDELAWLAERGPLRTRGARPVVRDIGYYEPRPGAIEAFARIGAGDRLRAMAFRLELGQDLRWRCTAVELGGPRPPRAEAD